MSWVIQVSLSLCTIPFHISTKQDQAERKHQSDTNHMIPPSHDPSNIMRLISSSMKRIKQTTGSSGRNKHRWSLFISFPQSLYINQKQTRFPDGHSCVLNNTITAPDTGKHDYLQAVNQEYSNTLKTRFHSMCHFISMYLWMNEYVFLTIAAWKVKVHASKIRFCLKTFQNEYYYKNM